MAIDSTIGTTDIARRIALIGMTGSGKSAYLGSLYSNPSPWSRAGYKVTSIPEPESVQFFAEMEAKFNEVLRDGKGRFPVPTSVTGNNASLRFFLKGPSGTISQLLVSITDQPGRVFRDLWDEEVTTKKALEDLITADHYLILLDPAEAFWSGGTTASGIGNFVPSALKANLLRIYHAVPEIKRSDDKLMAQVAVVLTKMDRFIVKESSGGLLIGLGLETSERGIPMPDDSVRGFRTRSIETLIPVDNSDGVRDFLMEHCGVLGRHFVECLADRFLPEHITYHAVSVVGVRGEGQQTVPNVMRTGCADAGISSSPVDGDWWIPSKIDPINIFDPIVRLLDTANYLRICFRTTDQPAPANSAGRVERTVAPTGRWRKLWPWSKS